MPTYVRRVTKQCKVRWDDYKIMPGGLQKHATSGLQNKARLEQEVEKIMPGYVRRVTKYCQDRSGKENDAGRLYIF